MRWEDIEFASDRFYIHKGKTGARMVPLFPRVAEELKKYRPGASEWVFPVEHGTNYSRCYWSIRRAVERSGVTRWPKLLNSLRASCITEYAHKNFHEVTLNSVFGNSEAVRKKYYVKVREQEYRAMIEAGRDLSSVGDKGSALSALSELLPLLSEKDLFKLWEDARKNAATAR